MKNSKNGLSGPKRPRNARAKNWEMEKTKKEPYAEPRLGPEKPGPGLNQSQGKESWSKTGPSLKNN